MSLSLSKKKKKKKWHMMNILHSSHGVLTPAAIATDV